MSLTSVKTETFLMKNIQQESAPRAAYVYVVRGAGLAAGPDAGQKDNIGL